MLVTALITGIVEIASCGKCRFCREGRCWMCQPHKIYGFFKDYNGGMAEYVKLSVQHSVIHRVPEDVGYCKKKMK